MPDSAIREYVSKAEQDRAHQLVAQAVADGRIQKPQDCAWCGRIPAKLHGHHPDYARPLMVVWLCPTCHRTHHARYDIERRLYGRL